jgi:hypothetical protein
MTNVVITPAEEDKIVVVAEENPKRKGTAAHKIWACYAKSKTVAEYYAAVARLRDVAPRRARTSLRYDQRHGFVKVVTAAKKAAGATQSQVAKAPRAAPAQASA